MARGVNHRVDVGFESRNLALAVLLKIESQCGYANLVLPAELGKANLENRDSAFVTEIVYGTLRQRNLYDEIIASAAKRSVKKIDVVPLNILRMTAHQLLTLETPAHAAVDSAVRLTVRNKSGSASGFVNAISRRISERSRSEWISQLCQGRNQIEQLSLTFAHPKWIVEKYFERLGSWDAVERELSAELSTQEIIGRWLQLQPAKHANGQMIVDISREILRISRRFSGQLVVFKIKVHI